MKLNKSGNKRGVNTWKNVPKLDRKKIMTERANQLWIKIRAGKLTNS